MKLSFSTLFCPGYSVDELIGLCKKYGVNAVELKMQDGTWCGTDNEKMWNDASKRLEEENITVTDVAASVTVKGILPLKEETPLFDVALRFAACFKAKAIRIFAGNWAMKVPEEKPVVSFEKISEYIRCLCVKAEKLNIEVWLETHNYDFSDGASVKKLADMVNKDNFKIIWDVLHSMEAGESIEETLNLIGNITAHVHYKDAVPFEDENMFLWKHTILGEGNVPIKRVAQLLKERNYDGYYSLEWEGNGKAELKELKLSPEAVLGKYMEIMKG